MQNQEVPTGAKVISVLFYIQAAGSAIATIFVLIGAIRSLIKTGGESGFGSIMLLILFLVLIAFTVLLFSIAKGLWNGKNGARIGAMIISVILTVFYLTGIVLYFTFLSGNLAIFGGVATVIMILPSILVLGVNVFIWVYLGFNKKVKQAFKGISQIV